MAMAGKDTGKHRKLHLEKIQVEPEIVPDRFNAPDVAVRHPEGYVCGDLFNILALKGIKSAEPVQHRAMDDALAATELYRSLMTKLIINK